MGVAGVRNQLLDDLIAIEQDCQGGVMAPVLTDAKKKEFLRKVMKALGAGYTIKHAMIVQASKEVRGA